MDFAADLTQPKGKADPAQEVTLEKTNIVMVGPTGVGEWIDFCDLENHFAEDSRGNYYLEQFKKPLRVKETASRNTVGAIII